MDKEWTWFYIALYVILSLVALGFTADGPVDDPDCTRENIADGTVECYKVHTTNRVMFPLGFWHDDSVVIWEDSHGNYTRE